MNNDQHKVSHLVNVGSYLSAGVTPTGHPTLRKKFVAKGHDAQLQEAQYDGREVRIITASGAEVFGKIARRDKYTITLEATRGKDAGAQEIFYKSAIESVQIKKSVPAFQD